MSQLDTFAGIGVQRTDAAIIEVVPKLDAQKESEKTSRGELAYTRLRAAIEAGRFRPGERLREAQVAQWLTVSRTPVRDAMKRLETEGLLTLASKRGLVVAELDQQQISELYAVRGVLEGLAARLAAQHASDAEVSAMREHLERQARHLDDFGALARFNQVFHEIVSRAARNRYLLQALDSFQSSLNLLPGTTYAAAPGRANATLREHTQLVDAIERRNSDLAERLVRNHIHAAERIRQMMATADVGPLTPPTPVRRPRARRRTT